jgi:hypothetical protein
MKKSLPGKWIKIIVQLKQTVDNYRAVTRKIVEDFERGFKVKQLYYARYVDLESIRFEISALTDIDWETLRVFFRLYSEVLKVEVVDRGEGSLAHAYAYQAVKCLPDFDRDAPDDDALGDVVHWMCNMRGLDYIREARFYSYGALNIAHRTAIESEKNLNTLRTFNVKARMARTAEELSSRLSLAADAFPRVKAKSNQAPGKTTGPGAAARRKRPSSAR